MKTLELEVTPREAGGSRASGRLRREGRVPAVVYGESGTQPLTVEAKAFEPIFERLLHDPALVRINHGGEEGTLTFVQDVQRDNLTGRFLHIDLREVVRGKESQFRIVAHTAGEAYGVRFEKGVLEQQAYQLNIRCRPRHLPEHFEIDISELHVGDSVHVRDLPTLEGVTWLDDPDMAIVTCLGEGTGAQSLPEAGEGEEDAEPEVIGEEKDEESSEEGEESSSSEKEKSE